MHLGAVEFCNRGIDNRSKKIGLAILLEKVTKSRGVSFLIYNREFND